MNFLRVVALLEMETHLCARECIDFFHQSEASALLLKHVLMHVFKLVRTQPAWFNINKCLHTDGDAPDFLFADPLQKGPVVGEVPVLLMRKSHIAKYTQVVPGEERESSEFVQGPNATAATQAGGIRTLYKLAAFTFCDFTRLSTPFGNGSSRQIHQTCIGPVRCQWG